MVAYSFQPMFVDPILVGLGLPPRQIGPEPEPKTHTIRVESRKRHARPGEIVQLYCQQRTANGFKIADASCRHTAPIVLDFKKIMLVGGPVGEDTVEIAGEAMIDTLAGLDKFARSDGFPDWQRLRAFWREHHPRVRTFRGIIVYWEPKK